MANKVFANGREIAGKSASGKSIAAFPDVCFTPPLTPATPPGVPIPYPNTGMASDTTDGSTTVQISGEPVMLKNQSCFSKSTGDEAGSAPKKGVVTSKNMGKVYFNAWSMDVKVEGQNVDRHLDLTTHNHAAKMPGNSPPMTYTDGMAPGGGGGAPDCGCPTGPTTGSPVNPILGAKLLTGHEDLDFVMSGPLPLAWQRTYLSSNLRSGWFGQGWSSVLEVSLEATLDGGIDFIDEFGRRTSFPRVAPGTTFLSRYEKTTLSRTANGQFRLVQLDGTTLHFDGGGDLPYRLAKIVDRNGNAIRVEAADERRRLRVHCSGGQLVELTFDRDRLIEAAEIRGSGRVPLARYAYDGQGDLTKVFNRAGECVRDFRWREHLMVYHQFAAFEAFYEYTGSGSSARVTKHWNNVGESRTFEQGERSVQVTDQDGRATIYHFDSARRWTGTTDAAGQTTERYLDAYGNVRATVDPAGHTTETIFDERSNPVSFIDPSGARTEVEWHPDFPLPIAITDPIGRTRRFEYDVRGNLRAEIEPSGARTEFELDHRGFPIAVVDGKGGKKEIAYNDAGQILSYIDCAGKTTTFSHDGNGWLTAVTDAQGGVTRFEYDPAGRLIARRNADGGVERFGYDAVGRLVSFTDGNGAVTRFELAADGLPVARTDALGHPLISRYDTARRVTALIDENGASYSLEYDALDRVTRVRTFDGITTAYRYDPSGYIVEQVEAAGTSHAIRSELRRDPAGRLLARTTSHAAVAFTYDKAGQIIEAVNAHAQVSLSYDADGRLVGEILETPDGRRKLTHQYDELGNRTQTTLADGRQLNFLYDGSGHLQQINIDGTIISEIERDDLHREIERSQGSLQTRFTYDSVGRLIDQAVERSQPQSDGDAARTAGVPGPHAAHIARHYRYDPAGQLLEQSNGKRPIAYQYDTLGRLLAAGDERFDFDPAHNLLQAAFPGGPVPPSRPVPGNRLTVFDDKRYGYDDHGRVIEKRIGRDQMIELRWDDEHQLVESVTSTAAGRQTTCYVYDPFGRRIRKDGPGGPTFFLWDGDRLLEERSGDVTRTYVYEPGGAVPLAQLSSAPSGIDVRYYHCDQIGAARELTDFDGNVVWQATNRAWGGIDADGNGQSGSEIDDGRIHQPLRFEGQYFDAETGFHFNRFRYYDPDVGRFISHDPIGLFGGLNQYLYGPNPTGWRDPLGLCACDKCAIVIGETQARVDAYAKKAKGTPAAMGYTLYTVKTLPGFKWATSAIFPGGPKTEDQWQKSLEENKKFMNMAKEQGCDVIDIGRDPKKEDAGEPISRYYDLERNMSKASKAFRMKPEYVAMILGAV